jgi:hypothetical protein
MKTQRYLNQLFVLGVLLLAVETAKAQFNYTTQDGKVTITRYTGTGGVVSIPSTINNLPVTSIGTGAFSNCTSITTVQIPGGITSIGPWAFYGCSGLTSVGIPYSVTNMGTGAFEFCYGLASIMIFNGVTTIGDQAFYYCTALQTVTMPNSVTSIGNEAFYNCIDLGSVTFGDGVTNIGSSAFYYCTSLMGVTIGNHVTNIGSYAFYNCMQLASVTISDSVTSIGDNAFDLCWGLTNLVIGDGVTNIGGAAFFGCTLLPSVTIPNGVTSIGEGAFEDCSDLTGAYFLGNAPNADCSVFLNDPVTVYYWPGTTGWPASTFPCVPTAPWTPFLRVLNNTPGSGVQSNGFGFMISWPTNVSFVVQATTNLANPVWTPLATNALVNGTNYFSDPDWTNYPGRFYRVTSP